MANTKQNQMRVFQLGIVFGVLIFIIEFLARSLMADFYKASNPEFWLQGLELWAFFAYIVTGLLYALGYSIFYKGIPGRGIVKGLQYGFWIWMVGTIPAIFTALISFNIPTEIIIGWIIITLFASLFLGIFVGALYRPNSR